jgi:hypothetical protein
MPQEARGRNPSLDGGLLPPENSIMTAKKTLSEERKQRLAKALKRNIARRKAGAAGGSKPAPDAPRPPRDDKSCPN